MSRFNIFPDASYCRHSRCGGWGAALTRKDGLGNWEVPVLMGGFLPGPLHEDVTLVEMQAAESAIRRAMEVGLVQPADTVKLVFDSASARDALRALRRDQRVLPHQRDAGERLLDFFASAQLTLKLSQMNGHTMSVEEFRALQLPTEPNTSGVVLNEWADRISRYQRDAGIALLMQEHGLNHQWKKRGHPDMDTLVALASRLSPATQEAEMPGMRL